MTDAYGRRPDRRPRCAKCGEPARYAKALARVRFVLDDDGSVGRVDRVARVPSADVVGEVSYVCAGGHEWGAS